MCGVACGGVDTDSDLITESESTLGLVSGTHDVVVVTPHVSNNVWTVDFDGQSIDDDQHMLILPIPQEPRSFADWADFQQFMASQMGATIDPATGSIYTDVVEYGPVYTDLLVGDPAVAQVLEIEEAELAFVGGLEGGFYVNGVFHCLDDGGCTGTTYPSYLAAVDEDMPAEPGDDDWEAVFLPKRKVVEKNSTTKRKYKVGNKNLLIHRSARVAAKIKSRQGERTLTATANGLAVFPIQTPIPDLKLPFVSKTKLNARRVKARRSKGVWGTAHGIFNDISGMCGSYRVSRSNDLFERTLTG
jgi:hypothetical protein